jgi:hypothetical protein
MAPPNRSHGHRLTLDISDDAYQRLGHASLADGVKIAPRLRELIDVWSEDVELQEKVLRRLGKYRPPTPEEDMT